MKNNNDTKRKLIDITRQMIDKNGIDSVSMREIGKEMSMSRSAVYRHFKNKEDLLAAIVAEDFELVKKDINKLVEGIDDPKKLVGAIMHTYYDFGTKNREHYQMMFIKEWNKEQYPNIYASAFELFELVEKCLLKAQPRNVNKTIKELTAMVYAFLHGLVELSFARHSETEKGLDDPFGLINSFLDIILA